MGTNHPVRPAITILCPINLTTDTISLARPLRRPRNARPCQRRLRILHSLDPSHGTSPATYRP